MRVKENEFHYRFWVLRIPGHVLTLWKWLRSCASPALSTRWTEIQNFLMEALRARGFRLYVFEGPGTFNIIVLMVMYPPFRFIFRCYYQQQSISYPNASPYQSYTVVNKQVMNRSRQLNISSSQGSGTSKSKADNSRFSFRLHLSDVRWIWLVGDLGGGILKFLQGGGENYSTPLRTRCIVRISSNQKRIEPGPSLKVSLADLFGFSLLLGSCKRLTTRSSLVRSWVLWATFSMTPLLEPGPFPSMIWTVNKEATRSNFFFEMWLIFYREKLLKLIINRNLREISNCSFLKAQFFFGFYQTSSRWVVAYSYQF